jgi:choline dehydrogenase-like flavoprotein
LSSKVFMDGKNLSTLRASSCETEALTEGLVLGGKRCTGVRYSVAGDVREARAAREVVVSAGTINSPQLLELSGIGQPEGLRNLGIEVRHALPGVGESGYRAATTRAARHSGPFPR